MIINFVGNLQSINIKDGYCTVGLNCQLIHRTNNYKSFQTVSRLVAFNKAFCVLVLDSDPMIIRFVLRVPEGLFVSKFDLEIRDL